MFVESEQDEYLTRCVVDTSTRTFNLYSNLGDEKIVKCDNMNEFMNVLSFVRGLLEEDTLVYSEPLVAK
jgi:hypothetical protein